MLIIFHEGVRDDPLFYYIVKRKIIRKNVKKIRNMINIIEYVRNNVYICFVILNEKTDEHDGKQCRNKGFQPFQPER